MKVIYNLLYLLAELQFQCTFEENECGLVQRTDDKFDWRRQSGQTPSSGTGPRYANQGTYYLYAEASSPRVEGDKAV